MAFVDDLADLLRKGFGGVRGREPGCFDVVLVEEVQEAVDADCRAEDAAGYVGRVCRRSVFGVEPRLGVSLENRQV